MFVCCSLLLDALSLNQPNRKRDRAAAFQDTRGGSAQHPVSLHLTAKKEEVEEEYEWEGEEQQQQGEKGQQKEEVQEGE